MVVGAGSMFWASAADERRCRTHMVSTALAWSRAGCFNFHSTDDEQLIPEWLKRLDNPLELEVGTLRFWSELTHNRAVLHIKEAGANSWICCCFDQWRLCRQHRIK